MITIVDYGLGNLRSVQKAFERIGAKVLITSSSDEILKSDKLVLPGVGHFNLGMKNLRKNNLREVLNEKVLIKKTPILGICLGMQLMTNHSEEGNCEGLAWINANTIKFSLKETEEIRYKIPHMGWNNTATESQNSLLNGISNEDYFYFVHSYYVKCNHSEDVLLSTNYGNSFHSGFNKDNIYGVQFHPEKSHKVGLTMLRNFVKI